jgi:hypothetical protein
MTQRWGKKNVKSAEVNVRLRTPPPREVKESLGRIFEGGMEILLVALGIFYGAGQRMESEHSRVRATSA